ncbi:hypothetical protein DPMN_165478 [Dreissena polymorpha]|uniref:Uncharacterized protein n=1 Tax=Dreissena polymorpha TaxID=45954 RepID=A0A9D4IWF5_DREPO|nr:hypothetical protein DPMN_165478 [Dreissena polymorpha]
MGDRQTTKAGLVWTRHKTQLPVQECAQMHAIGSSRARPSEEKLDGGSLCRRLPYPP